MRVLQIIDTLHPGGAERMAVNLTNSLINRVEFSGICITREKGALFSKINPGAKKILLNKKNIFDYNAFQKLYKYIKQNRITIIHAHGSSFFYACLIKIFAYHIKIVWHDHYGFRIKKKGNDFPVLKICSLFFNGIITVNMELSHWNPENFFCSKVIYIPNFITNEFIFNLKGKRKEKEERINILYIANFKKPKNHLNLLKAFKIVHDKFPGCTLTLVGKQYGDDYETKLKSFSIKNNLQNRIIVAGEQIQVDSFLQNSEIGIISSDSEGLPMALLEYGIVGLAVVCTNVGACASVVGQNGKIVEVNNSNALALGIYEYLENDMLREKDSKAFQKSIVENFTEEKIIPLLMDFYTSLNSKP